MLLRCIGAFRKSNYGCRFFTNTDSNYTTSDFIVPPGDARVVVCGGGVMGASVVYHLGKLGWGNQTVLIEQNR